MDTRTRFALASLATWRLTHLIAEEDGPADVVVRVRARLGESQLGALMDCFACTSMWTALPLAAVTAPRRRDAPLVWLALSGSACLLQRLTDNQGDPHVLWPEAHPDQDRENDRVAAAAR